MQPALHVVLTAGYAGCRSGLIKGQYYKRCLSALYSHSFKYFRYKIFADKLVFTLTFMIPSSGKWKSIRSYAFNYFLKILSPTKNGEEMYRLKLMSFSPLVNKQKRVTGKGCQAELFM